MWAVSKRSSDIKKSVHKKSYRFTYVSLCLFVSETTRMDRMDWTRMSVSMICNLFYYNYLHTSYRCSSVFSIGRIFHSAISPKRV